MRVSRTRHPAWKTPSNKSFYFKKEANWRIKKGWAAAFGKLCKLFLSPIARLVFERLSWLIDYLLFGTPILCRELGRMIVSIHSGHDIDQTKFEAKIWFDQYRFQFVGQSHTDTKTSLSRRSFQAPWERSNFFLFTEHMFLPYFITLKSSWTASTLDRRRGRLRFDWLKLHVVFFLLIYVGGALAYSSLPQQDDYSPTSQYQILFIN